MSVESALQSKLTKFKQDLLAYKRLALDKQASLPVAVVPQPTSALGQGEQWSFLNKYPDMTGFFFNCFHLLLLMHVMFKIHQS